MSTILGMKKSRAHGVRQAVYQHVNTSTTINAGAHQLFTSSHDNAIDKSICICMLLKNIEAQHQSILSNISILQNLFRQTFFVFVLCGESKMTELTFNKINSSLLIQTFEIDEHKQRNLYLKFVLENKKSFNYMAVIDPLTCLITPLKPNSFDFFKSGVGFSAVFANQSYKYYDIESLVTDTVYVNLITDQEEKRSIIKSQQKHIHKESGNLIVKSAFGGFGIYNVAVLDPQNRYTTDNHISFNLKISALNPDMFIVSSFVIETSPDNVSLYV